MTKVAGPSSQENQEEPSSAGCEENVNKLPWSQTADLVVSAAADAPKSGLGGGGVCSSDDDSSFPFLNTGLWKSCRLELRPHLIGHVNQHDAFKMMEPMAPQQP